MLWRDAIFIELDVMKNRDRMTTAILEQFIQKISKKHLILQFRTNVKLLVWTQGAFQQKFREISTAGAVINEMLRTGGKYGAS